MGIEFSLFLPQMRMSFATILERARCAEEAGWDGISLMDHLAPPALPAGDMYDGFVTAAAIATATERLRIGHLVICAGFRHPALLARMAVSLDHLSGGRFDLGIGWGSVPDELERFDLHPEPPAVRSARLAETLEILQRLFTGEPIDHDGSFFTLRGAQQRPVPVNGAIPVLIGGGGPKLTMPLVARFADWWNCPSYAVDGLAELRPLAGRARVSTQHPVGLAASSAVLDEVNELAQRRFRGWGGLLVGTPDQIADALIAEVRQGVERFYVPFTDFSTPDTIELFAREVIPAVRTAV